MWEGKFKLILYCVMTGVWSDFKISNLKDAPYVHSLNFLPFNFCFDKARTKYSGTSERSFVERLSSLRG